MDCKRCGNCCRYLVDQSDEEVSKIWARGHRDFFYVKNKKAFLNKIDGNCIFFDGRCRIYDLRPEPCRRFTAGEFRCPQDNRITSKLRRGYYRLSLVLLGKR